MSEDNKEDKKSEPIPIKSKRAPSAPKSLVTPELKLVRTEKDITQEFINLMAQIGHQDYTTSNLVATAEQKKRDLFEAARALDKEMDRMRSAQLPANPPPVA